MLTMTKEKLIGEIKPFAFSFFAKQINRLLKLDLASHLATLLIQYTFVLFESRNIKRKGIYQYKGTGLDNLSYCSTNKPLPINTKKPVLLFIHGTISSSEDCFAGFWGDKSSEDIDELIQVYGQQIFFIDHYTLSESPVHNALVVAKAFPTQTRFHIVSHSRGGLIGELLCQSRLKRRSRHLPRRFFETNEIFSEKELERFRRTKSLQSDYQELKELQSLFCQKHFLVERFVRIAAPIKGTLLASNNLEKCIHTLCFAINTLPLPRLFGLVFFIRDVLLAMIKQLKDEAIVPGIASMKPDAPLIELLNRPNVRLQNELTVVSGVSEKTCLTAKLTGLIFREQHDFVVNTAAMTGGCRRTLQIDRHYREQGRDINHFLYFMCDSVRQRLKRTLLSPVMLVTGELGMPFKSIPEYLKRLMSKKIAYIKENAANFIEDQQNADKFAPDKRLALAA